MLFNSYAFILAFLPFAVLLYHGLRHWRLERTSILALTLLSLFFYGWWNPVYLLLLVPLMLANFVLARLILERRVAAPARAKALLILGVSGNVAVLAWFKYANFLVDNLNALSGLELELARVVLPLGISFFTFQKIAFLVDAWRGRVDRMNLLDFSLFVSFFPQLIAGPIVHHSEVLPQFRRSGAVDPHDLALGLTIFALGLAKKVLLADSAALHATPVFDAAAAGGAPGLLASWTSALAYTVQLYFDFSGYSDMAIGAALLFGIRLPVNFASPYKAANIIDFWRRWHITLSRFLRDYLYFPLGGARRGIVRRYANLLLTMLLGGLWHGANWTFVLWGALHGAFLVVNHLWRDWRARLLPGSSPGYVELGLGRALTFVAVVVGWVFFRAADIASALAILKGMVGLNGIAATGGAEFGVLVQIALMLLIAWFAPNTQQITAYRGPSADHAPESRHFAGPVWRSNPAWAAAVGGVFALALLSLSQVSEFLYFQF